MRTTPKITLTSRSRDCNIWKRFSKLYVSIQSHSVPLRSVSPECSHCLLECGPGIFGRNISSISRVWFRSHRNIIPVLPESDLGVSKEWFKIYRGIEKPSIHEEVNLWVQNVMKVRPRRLKLLTFDISNGFLNDSKIISFFFCVLIKYNEKYKMNTRVYH